MVAGLILIIQCRIDPCPQDPNIFLAAGCLQVVSALVIGYISYLYNPAFMKELNCGKSTPKSTSSEI